MADWTKQAVDAIEQVVALVRDKTVKPAQSVTRAIVYGLLTAFLALTGIVILTVGVFRGLVILTGETWIAYFVCAAIFLVAGAVCWSMRPPRAVGDGA
jgi:hypothetical protein